MRYEVNTDGSCERQAFFDMTSVDGRTLDGMKIDQKGNSTAGPGGLWIISPEGKHLGTNCGRGAST